MGEALGLWGWYQCLARLTLLKEAGGELKGCGLWVVLILISGCVRVWVLHSRFFYIAGFDF